MSFPIMGEVQKKHEYLAIIVRKEDMDGLTQMATEESSKCARKTWLWLN